jgi:hypothetical protein
MRHALHRDGYPRRDPLRVDANQLDQLPGKRLLEEKLGLLGFFHIRGAKIGRRNRVPVDIAQPIQPRPELRIDRARVRERKGSSPSVLLCPLDNMMQVGLQMHDRLLAAPIGKFGMVCAMNHKQHNRTWTKIERDICAHVRALMAGNGKAKTALLDAAHADRCAALALRHNRI